LWVTASTESAPSSFLKFRASGLHTISLRTGVVSSRGLAPRVLHWLPGDPERVLIEFLGSVTRMHSLDGERDERAVQRPKRGIQRWHADADGNVRAGEGFLDGRYRLFARASVADDFERVIAWDAREEDGPRFAAFHAQPGKIYVVAPHAARRALFSFDFATRALELAFAHPEFDVQEPETDLATGRVIGASYVADSPELHLFAEADARERAGVESALEGRLGHPLTIGVVSREQSSRLEIVAASADVLPPTYYVHDRKRGSLTLLFSERPQLLEAPLAATRRLDIAARDGLSLPSYLTLPHGLEPKQLPLIVLPHGGPSSRDTITWNPEVQLFASRGFAVIQVNFRGSEGYGEEFLEAGHREWGGKMQDDLTDAVRALIAGGIADPDRVGIYGASYGGYAALMGLVATPELYRAGAAYAAVTDVRTLLYDERRYRPGYVKVRLQEEVGGGSGDSKRLRLVSPERRAAEIRVPVLLGHGAVDLSVPVKHSRDMAAALHRAGKPVEYLEFPHEIHGFLLEANRVKWYEALIAFFEKNLAPREQPSAGAP
jgi:dienelactone hydrolase